MQQQSSQASCAGSLDDQAVAFDALKDSKFCLSALAMAATKSTNSQFRVFLTNSLTDTMNEHFMLSDILINKGWYTPSNVEQQLMTDVELASQLSGQNNSRKTTTRGRKTHMAQAANTPAPHEMLELHELMRSELICAKKLETSMTLVSDPELKTFMEQSLTTKKNTLHQCEQFSFKIKNQRQ